ncbi:hypothetical protein BKP45_08475 [Anaerobacillus alkalidiazotrophicus]|uniref:Activator of Hsp90 ATPase homologue 1/2-like C-terminal domain-containing protein n=1 Tax=Anaerobacillus alkalidiazotrophicus TaxID=472963 RepID=A0A1S2M7U1_9BACI|nr:SRPBCC domain-containing protein [Anaerobacillus alkalidiazotrophicus]OIJ20818.1 hypothetical protein BKP45_08475 [Anaerobacillus alkalidiazotrophicus]
MADQLFVQDEIIIEATPARVWEILTKPKYVAQWDDLPENYPNEDMKVGSKVVWDLPDGSQSITTIIKADERERLKIALYCSFWEVKPNYGDLAYLYELEDKKGSTLLKISIGDFSLINDGQKFYCASVDFALEAKIAIKNLAEKQ